MFTCCRSRRSAPPPQVLVLLRPDAVVPHRLKQPDVAHVTSATHVTTNSDARLGLLRALEVGVAAAQAGIAVVALSHRDLAVLPGIAPPQLDAAVAQLQSGSNAMVRYADLVPEVVDVALHPADIAVPVSDATVWNKSHQGLSTAAEVAAYREFCRAIGAKVQPVTGRSELLTVYRMRHPLFNPATCQWVIDAAERYARRHGGWSTQRHESYPTTDLPVQRVPELHPLFALVRRAVFPLISRAYRIGPVYGLQVCEGRPGLCASAPLSGPGGALEPSWGTRTGGMARKARANRHFPADGRPSMPRCRGPGPHHRPALSGRRQARCRQPPLLALSGQQQSRQASGWGWGVGDFGFGFGGRS